MGSGEFSGSGQTPAIRQAPPLHLGGTRPLPNRTTATITSHTAPAVTMASYGGVSAGEAYSFSGQRPEHSGLIPHGQSQTLQQLWSDVMACYPVEPSEPAPTRPTSLGLANFQQAKPEKETNLPLSPSLEAWLICRAQTLLRAKNLPKTTILDGQQV